MRRHRWLAAFASTGAIAAASLGIATVAQVGAAVPTRSEFHQFNNEFLQTNLVSNLSDQGAQVVDPTLQNPWGLALSPTSPLWVADNNGAAATVYKINVGGTQVSGPLLTVPLPGGRASTGDGPSPTGQVFNPTQDFAIGSGNTAGPAMFIFDSEAGQLTAWSRQAGPQVEFSSPTAVYKGLTLGQADDRDLLYALNFHDRSVDVFNTRFHKVHVPGRFEDNRIPANYAPFGIQNIGGFIFVTYAQQNAAKHDDVAGPGHGFIDVYTTEGFLVKRLAAGGALNSPWGLTLAPNGFGPFGGKLLVGNFGDGTIHAFSPRSGRFLGAVLNEQHQPIQIDDLWGLHFGTSTTGGTNTLLFSAGINDEHDGLVGSINAVP